MLFRPNFCANCGEKIERAEWFPWTSRRFCIVCESEYKGHDLIPKVVVAASLLVGIFGVGGYLTRGSAETGQQALRQLKHNEEKAAVNAASPAEPSRPPLKQTLAQTPAAVPGNTRVETVPQRSLVTRSQAEDPVYYCGAETKKGTPCSRRVKGNTRCFQHLGMPSMTAASSPSKGR